MLLPLYHFAAWTRDNDAIEAGRQLQEEKAQRRQAHAFEVGDRVRIRSGPFAGKIGLVHGTDTKARVKVKIDVMAIVVPGEDLVALSR